MSIIFLIKSNFRLFIVKQIIKMESGIIYYFKQCCGGFPPFGITSGATDDWSSWFDPTNDPGYPLSVGSFSGCVSYSGTSGSQPLPNITIYNNVTPIITNTISSNCLKCLVENPNYNCVNPTPVVTPIIVGYKNDCGIITILPMVVECEVSNPSSVDAYDGEVSLSISGGTPPYKTTWLNYNIVSPALNGLSNDSYTATTVDYWGDFTATTVCTILTERDCVFSGSIANYTPPPVECYCYEYSFTVQTPGYVCWTPCGGEGECTLYGAGIEVNDTPCIQGPFGNSNITVLSETLCGNWCDPSAPIYPFDNTKYYYTIQITDGTSPGPYTIYYNAAPPSPGYIPIMVPSGDLAENLSLSTLQTGVIIEVPNDTGVIYIYNPLCPDNTVVLIVPTITTYSDFCLTIQPNRRRLPIVIHFTYDSLDSNNNPIWIGDDNPQSTINKVGNQWLLSTQIYGNTIFSTSQLTTTTTYPTNWLSSGNEFSPISISSIIVNEGSCGPTRKQLPPVSVNQPTCLCDGSIIFNIQLDNPPFNYSIDNGVNYSSSPIFTNLCSGIYDLSVIDSLGETYTSSVTLDKPTQLTTYSLSLYTTNTTPVNNNTSLVNSYETTVIINPPLPDGTTITFDIIHNNSFYSSPNSGTSILTTSTVLSKNSTTIPLSNTSNYTNESVNTITNCQKEYVYQSNVDEVWNSLTLTNSDTITISTTSRVDKTTLGECVVGYSNDSYSISNPVISGCDCCSIKIN
jgi:hypothetical protein